ncbi:ribonuclease III [Methanobrevibacter sp.]|uniref:ribonuclease III n=1 Tax=Methanobrevibacter sp. TaxID=66852 RepID=UPI0025F74D1B|nr:ribonuclease III [Methanobrevibacter sp.]MBQ6099970.1 ribonuclease III [Methanobrevibacter sp.]MBQ6512696.1 ribonuclease III [Methanobrevibacter sp.]
MNLFEKFGIETENEELYQIAFTHGSYSTIHHLDYNYERLEFLGDSVLSLIVSEYLYNKYPEYEEGKLTKLRANYVCQSALIFYSHELGLTEYLKVSAEESNLTKNEVLSITADIFESFLGAMFIDQGIKFAKKFISDNIFQYIDEKRVFFTDYKSAIKEYADGEGLEIEYETLNEYGVPHDKTFFISILINGKEMGVGKGKNKKEAQQEAAKIAMEKLNIGVLNE